jgi:hypothetical protein
MHDNVSMGAMIDKTNPDAVPLAGAAGPWASPPFSAHLHRTCAKIHPITAA